MDGAIAEQVRQSQQLLAFMRQVRELQAQIQTPQIQVQTLQVHARLRLERERGDDTPSSPSDE